MKTGIELIAEERHRQIKSEGWTAEHDDLHHFRGELALAAASYAALAGGQSKFGTADVVNLSPPKQWPWGSIWWKPSNDKIKNLVRAGALIAAEIDRLKREEGVNNG